MLEKIKVKMYATHSCSCGCGQPLGHYAVGQWCFGVGETSDDEGYYWRMFTESCWEKVKNQPLETIYKNYPVSPDLD